MALFCIFHALSCELTFFFDRRFPLNVKLVSHYSKSVSHKNSNVMICVSTGETHSSTTAIFSLIPNRM